MDSIALIKKILLIFFAILCITALVFFLNFAVAGRPHKMVSDYETVEYARTVDNKELRLTVVDETTLVGSFNDDGVITNIMVKYENYGTAYEYYTAKIYNSDTSEYIDYVTIECDGNKLRLTSKIENLDSYDPPDILNDINANESLFLFFNFNKKQITLEAIS